MPHKPTLSPTKISTYLACAVKYKWTYADNRGKWYLRTKSYYSFGSSLHAVLQRFHDSGDQGVTTTGQALAALEETWIQAGYVSQDEMLQAMSEGKAIIENYTETFKAQAVTANTLWVEKTLTADLGPFTLIGRVDRLDEREDGTLEIVDYKSGRSSVTPEDVANDLAMGVYQILVREQFPGRKVVATIFALQTGEKATSSFSDEEAASFRSDLLVIGNEVLNRDFENVEPTGKWLCRDCDFLPLCSRHPEFELANETN
ncbi:MAG: PD-(D/E)XK nuclease family protein [Armatimonadetes bacterium]|nr:PD-(D/E)XK nuclease family protein [Armatimonadota bacterium]